MLQVTRPGFCGLRFASYSVTIRGGSESPTNTESRTGVAVRIGGTGFEGDRPHAAMAAAATVNANRCGLIVARRRRLTVRLPLRRARVRVALRLASRLPDAPRAGPPRAYRV